MQIVSFDAFRSLGLPNVDYVKPEQMFREQQRIARANWLLFPQYWQLNSLSFGLKQKIFPSPASYYLGHTKAEMTRLFQLCWPQHTPQTLILANTPANREQIWQTFALPFVAKELKNAMGQGVFLIDSRTGFDAFCARQEVLYCQEYLPIERDLRLVLIGERVVAGYWRQAPEGCFHNNVAQGGKIRFDPIPTQAVALVEQIARQTGINHAGFDIAMVGSHPYLLEFNRLFGNQGLKQHGIDLAGEIWRYLRAPSAEPSTLQYEPSAAEISGRNALPGSLLFDKPVAESFAGDRVAAAV